MKPLLRILALLPAIIFGMLAAHPLSAAEAGAQKPNIIFILADDLGIGSVSSYGADHFKTPNVDKLAESGIRFEHCYASPLCGPSRALLLTGRYAFHTGMTGNDTGYLVKPANETMIPKILKPAGYVTAQVGKWAQLPLQPSNWGFDEYLRFQGSGKYWNTQNQAKSYIVNGKNVPLKDNEYLPDVMHNFLVDFIRRHKDQPFYIHYAMSHVHGKILRTPDTRPGTTDFYADNVAYMDKLVGELIAELDRLKLRNNTLIIFAGDNGTAPQYAARCTINGGKALSGHKNTMLECGALVPMIASWPGVVPSGKVSQSLVSFCDFLPTFADFAGAKLPKGLVVDGKTFTQLLRGQNDTAYRDWIFVMLRKEWYDRESSWKLNQSGQLFDMKNAPYAEPLIPADTKNTEALAARQRLQGVLDILKPDTVFKTGPQPSGRKPMNSENANADDQ